MQKEFKLNYKECIFFVFILTLISLLTAVLNKFILYFFLDIKKFKCLLFPFIYLFPFITFFIFFFKRIKKNNINFNSSKVIFSKIKIYPLIIIITICGIIITSYISSIIPYNNYTLEEMYKKMEKLINDQLNCPISLIISTVLFAPICEELFFRGILLKGLLSNNIKSYKAIIFSSFLFGIVHMNPWQFIGGMIIGTIFGIIYFYTKSLFNCIFLHSLNNFIAIISLLKEKNDFNIFFSIISKNIWIFIITIFTIIIFIYLLSYQYNKKLEKFL